MSDVVGLGNPLIDILISVDDTIVTKLGLKKGIMHLVDMQKSEQVLNTFKKESLKIAPGDSTANTLAGISNLGGKTVFFGKIGNDEYGEYYKQNLVESNIKPCLAVAEIVTGKVISLITPDTERTMVVYLGAANKFSKEDILENEILNSKFLHLTGYQLEEPSLKDAALTAMKIAKDGDVTISLDLADSSLVTRNLDFIKDVIRDYVSIVFANENEAKALTGLEPEQAVTEISKSADIAVVKIGKDGSIIKTKGGLYRIELFKVEAVDTTGAGDMYAAGFLFGLSKGLSVEVSGKIGSYAASKVVQVVGGRLKDKLDIDFIIKQKKVN